MFTGSFKLWEAASCDVWVANVQLLKMVEAVLEAISQVVVTQLLVFRQREESDGKTQDNSFEKIRLALDKFSNKTNANLAWK